jgi:hypothetical protein
MSNLHGSKNYSLLSKLKNNGYVVLKNKLTEEDLNYGLNSVNDDKINYSHLKSFIDTKYFPVINSSLGWKSKYLKFRFSNFDNLKDASLFHGDVYNHTNNNIMPIYTGLCYFDDSLLEIIPKSHIKKNLSSNCLYEKKKILKVSRGDILIFHANMFHRGIACLPTTNPSMSTKTKQTNRRLLQIFEIFPNQLVFDKLKPNFLTVLTNKTDLIKKFYNFSSFESKNVSDYIVYLHYLLVIYDMQYKIILSDISNAEKKNKYVGYEPGPREKLKLNELQNWNINIIVEKHNTIVPNTNCQLIFLCLLIILIYLTFNKMIK